jgi:chaperonin GroEL
MQENGYTPKKLEFDDEGREKLISGVRKIAKAVGSTLGSSGQNVLIESPSHTHGITVTKDGVTVAKAISLIDPTENLAVRMVKEAAERTALAAGDGTTTSIVLTEAFVESGLRHITENKTEILRGLVDETKKVVASLKSNSRAVTKGRLKDVATISANNDKAIGDIIAKVYKEVGKDGIVTIDKSQTSETYYETTNGIKIDRGYTSQLFINDHKRDECVFEDTYILVADTEISNVLQIESILKPVIAEGKKLLIIADCSKNVTNTLAANVVKRGMKVCVIPPPSFGYRQHELMNDIALSVGAKYFSEKTGDDLSLITPSDLGHASKVIIGKNKSIIVKDSSSSIDEAVSDRINQLRGAYEETNVKADREFILSRIASLSGGIGVIYAGGNTDLEQKELYDRIDDAVCAVRSALEEGIIAGGGVPLYNEAIKYEDRTDVVGMIMHEALMTPMSKIAENAGFSGVMFSRDQNYNYGFNVKTGEYGDMITMGVIDPLKVTRHALQNAVSVAVTILSTNAIITMARTIEE